ncbi:MAG: 4-(cytidine 5'-diphospho)-2-C-methyl-D-erythritol kinase [Paracoccaceae bacterium]
MSSKKLQELSRVKVNLYLHIIGKRADGYHNLDSLVAFPEIGDEILVSPSNSINLKITGKSKKELNKKENLILKATKLLKNRKMGADIHLKKDIPISAGLGGGSSNAAVTLKLLSKLWNVPLPTINELVLLGADVPVCMDWRLQRMQGIGEKSSFVVSPDSLWILLINNGDRVPTSTVFEGITQNESSGLVNIPRFNDKITLIKFLKSTGNDLEKSAIKMYPAIKNLIDSLHTTSGCLISRMSGSGSTCFGLYEKKDDAKKAKKHLTNKFPNAWIKVAKIFS